MDEAVLACLAMLGWLASRLLSALYADLITENAAPSMLSSEADRSSDSSYRPQTSTGKGSRIIVSEAFQLDEARS